MNDKELRNWMQNQADYNESFRGTKLNSDKLSKLNAMNQLCGQLHEADDRIETPFVPFDNHCCNATVKISIPKVYFSTNKRVQAMLSALFSAADDVWFSCMSGESIDITFGIHDMWDEFTHQGYEGDGRLIDYPKKKR